MNESRSNGDWDLWSDQWRGERIAPAELATLFERTKKARRAIAGVRALSLAVTVLAVAAVAAALYHAASVGEVLLGCAVAIGICAAWVIDDANQRGAHQHGEQPPRQYLMLRRALCVRRIRFARLVWIVAALDLVFLFPWWAGGIRYHGFGFRLVHVTSLWGPLAVIIAALVAAARVRRAAVTELKSIDRSSEAS